MALGALIAACDRGAPPEKPAIEDSGGPRRVRCEAWEITPAQRFDREDLFGDAELPQLRQEQGPGVALADLDGDGDLDLLYVVSDGRSFVLTNDGAGTFAVDDRWTADGGPLPPATSVAVSDLDADGDPDAVFTTPRGTPDLVLYNQGGSFTTAALPESEGEHLSPAFADLDGDGDLDLSVAGFVDRVDGSMVGPETVGDGQELYLREGDAWVLGTGRLPPEHQETLAYQLGPFDADDDQDVDLFISADFGIETGDPSELLRNEGDAFVADAGSGASSLVSAMGIAPGDYDGDGRLDVFVANWGRQILYRNLGGGSFVDASLSALIRQPRAETSEVAWGARFVDLDLDADEDLAVTFGPPNDHSDQTPLEQGDVLWFNDADGTFTDRTEGHGFGDLGIGRGLVTGDLDGNGRPDLVIAGRVYLLVWLGRGGCPGAVRLRLDGPPGNPEGIGARVDVVSPFATYRRWVWPAGLYGQSATELLLGLAGGTEAEVTVTWPDGGVSGPHTVVAEDVLTVAW